MLKTVKKEIASIIAEAAGISIEQSISSIEESQHFGDLASKVAFILAPLKKENPAKIASEIAQKLSNKKIDLIEKIEANGPYLNFYFSDDFYAKTLEQIIESKEEFGKGKEGKRIMLEFFDANTHKGVHIGHIRNISIGESLSRILEFAGNDIKRVNYQGDIGPHVAKCLWGFIKLYDKKAPPIHRGIWLGKVYGEASKKIKENPELEKEVQELNIKLYARDKEILNIWKETRQWCLDDFEEFYKEFGVNFDELFFESQTESIGKEIVLELLEKGIAKRDQGAIVMDLRDEGLGVFILLTKEGYPLYSTKDLGLAKLKFEKYALDKSIHVVGKEQEFYFKQLFKTFERIGGPLFGKAAKISYHLVYELVMLPEGKMSSREGTMVLYEDLKAKLMNIVKQEIKKRHEDWDERIINETAKKIVLAAIKFSMLRRENNRTLVFDWDEALNLEGDSGPYLQYAQVRANSILRKAGYRPEIVKGYHFSENERALIKKLAQLPEKVETCSKNLTPHPLVEYLLDVAAALNKFYTTCPVLVAEREEEQKTRLGIVLATSYVMKRGLYLLGIEVPERM